MESGEERGEGERKVGRREAKRGERVKMFTPRMGNPGQVYDVMNRSE